MVRVGEPALEKRLTYTTLTTAEESRDREQGTGTGTYPSLLQALTDPGRSYRP